MRGGGGGAGGGGGGGRGQGRGGGGGGGGVGVGVKGRVGGGGVVDTFWGSFSIHDASGSINLAVIMNSDFLSHRKRCDVYVSVVVCFRPP